jgi:2-C-methyl-D-erythritol 4-phosphate cytidylyltransferase
MGTTIPKQFLPLKGKAIILHTLEKFKEALPLAELLLVLPKPELSRWQEVAKGTAFENIAIANGGETRFESVKAGLKLIQSDGVVGVHDAVRPFVSVETIIATFKKAQETAAAIPVVELKDSIRRLESNNSAAVDRSMYRIVQTPQCFQTNLLLKAYSQPFQSKFTDDASVVEEMGHSIALVEGNNENIKITTLEDLKFGEALL